MTVGPASRSVVLHPPARSLPIQDSTRNRYAQACAVLDATLDLPEAEQDAYVDRTCSSDPELRSEVERLLRAYRTSGPFLATPAVELAAPLLATMPPLEAGRRLGPWRIVREVGRGGMSRVFAAERADGQFEQHAAVKVLRPGLDSELDLERFRVERQVLASLNHPNIARLLDGGLTPEGQPYLVMEYVDGLPIDAWCRERRLTIRERLALLLTVAEALQAAHRSLVVHRDLKPGNILVRQDGTLKLLDFGLAKLLEPQPADEAPATGTGQRWMTPEYAAPEQILARPVTTSTDVYQLGVVMYQVLSGRLPFAGRDGGLHTLEHAILHDEPPLPSAVAGTAIERQALRGDLDAIVMKSLRKEPDARFSSVQSLAEDLRRHLSGHPVQARRQTTAYRVRRYIQRNRLRLAMGTAVALLVIGYVSTVLVQRAEIRRALVDATIAVRRAEQTTDFMMGLFEAAEGGRALTDSVTARALLARGEAQARQLAVQPALQAQMFDVIGRLYGQLGEYDRARPMIEEALAVRRGLHGDEHPDVATSLEALADVADGKRELDEAIALRRQVLDLRRRLEGPRSLKAMNALHALALSLHRAGQDSVAWPLFDEWFTGISTMPGEQSARRAAELASAAALAQWRGHLERAEQMIRESLSIRRLLFGDHHPAVAAARFELGGVLAARGDTSGALPLLEETIRQYRVHYPDGHPELAEVLRNWAFLLTTADRAAEAEAALREALAIRRRIVGDQSIDVAIARLDLANLLTATRQYTEAEALARQGERGMIANLGVNSAMVTLARVHVADALRGLGRLREAEPLLEAAFERFRVETPFNAAWRRVTLIAIARLREAQGRLDEAREYWQMLQPASASR